MQRTLRRGERRARSDLHSLSYGKAGALYRCRNEKWGTERLLKMFVMFVKNIRITLDSVPASLISLFSVSERRWR
ncbi:hypothetical protein SBV1_960030 [Verrucomicrobia bacterium]|nr:hypothetical protein SBV1_960030 [Verrucomicrobiota bacterium]